MTADRRRPWVRHRTLGRRQTDRKWPRHMRDFWLFTITLLVLLALKSGRDTDHRISVNQRHNTQALCSFRDDIAERVQSTTAFLQSHPKGIPGIPAGTLRVSLINSQRTLRSLSPLRC